MNQSHLPGAQIAPPSYYFVSLKSFEIFKPKSTLNSAHKIHKESKVIVDHLIKVGFEVKTLLYSLQVVASLYFGSGLLTCLFFRNYIM